MFYHVALHVWFYIKKTVIETVKISNTNLVSVMVKWAIQRIISSLVRFKEFLYVLAYSKTGINTENGYRRFRLELKISYIPGMFPHSSWAEL
jgi:hypothetical protein